MLNLFDQPGIHGNPLLSGIYDDSKCKWGYCYFHSSEFYLGYATSHKNDTTEGEGRRSQWKAWERARVVHLKQPTQPFSIPAVLCRQLHGIFQPTPVFIYTVRTPGDILKDDTAHMESFSPLYISSPVTLPSHPTHSHLSPWPKISNQ